MQIFEGKWACGNLILSAADAAPPVRFGDRLPLGANESIQPSTAELS